MQEEAVIPFLLIFWCISFRQKSSRQEKVVVCILCRLPCRSPQKRGCQVHFLSFMHHVAPQHKQPITRKDLWSCYALWLFLIVIAVAGLKGTDEPMSNFNSEANSKCMSWSVLQVMGFSLCHHVKGEMWGFSLTYILPHGSPRVHYH